ncbi:hypothetical protein pdam_00006690 [Pocillopora damicornis]|uniref:Uncharacterized protein n=1 Tax=Pocillopora damicornis TaxID=46731 RepID=A0A3M6UW97_POCDA|nr:hypothetical protein pdam_00006690 [Pocillopora damicornis]
MKIWNSYPTRVLKQSNFKLRGCLSQPQLLHVEEPNDDGDAVNDVAVVQVLQKTHFTLLFCRGCKEIYKDLKRMCPAIVLLIKLFV